jgi:hypothetical protein
MEMAALSNSLLLFSSLAHLCSRKRGQVFSAGFLSVTEEAQYWKFLSVCPGLVPFLEGTIPLHFGTTLVVCSIMVG